MEEARQLFTASPVRKLILDLPDLQRFVAHESITTTRAASSRESPT
jgi:hypothetical protein